MICEIVIEKIYEQVYENTNHLDDELMRHIADCPSCNSYYEECLSAKKVATFLNQKQPVLNNPQKLTNSILDGINEIEPKKQDVRTKFFITAKRFLVAASVSLIIVFGYEQYVVMEKMIKLEEQMSDVQEVDINSSDYHQILINYPGQGIGFITSERYSRIFGSQDNDLKSFIQLANSGVLSRESILKRLQK